MGVAAEVRIGQRAWSVLVVVGLVVAAVVAPPAQVASVAAPGVGAPKLVVSGSNPVPSELVIKGYSDGVSVTGFRAWDSKRYFYTHQGTSYSRAMCASNGKVTSGAEVVEFKRLGGTDGKPDSFGEFFVGATSASCRPYETLVGVYALYAWGSPGQRFADYGFSVALYYSNHPQYDQFASSPGVVQVGGTWGASGPILPGEVEGGFNPSEDYCQRCHGDPINSATGEFWESHSDLQLAAPGPPVELVRSYGSSRAQESGSLGFGWVTGLDMVVVPVTPASGDLASARVVAVEQENGSRIYFTQVGLSTSTYVADARVFAELKRMPSGGYELTRGGRTVFSFDPAGRLLAQRDLNGNTVSVQRDGDGRITRVRSDDDRWITLSWDGTRISTARDQDGRTVAYGYSSTGDLETVTAADGGVTRYDYDGQHRVVSMTNPLGGITTNEYDSDDRVTRQTDPLGRAISFAYGSSSTTITNPDGAVTVEQYLNGQLLSETHGAGTSLAQATIFTYGPTSQVESRTDALGRVTRFTYDARGNRTSVTDPLGRVSTSTFDSLNNPLVVTNPAGESTTYAYDARGNLTSTTAADGGVTSATVNPDGTVASTTDPLGRSTTFGYDAHRFMSRAVGPDGAVTTISNDAMGNRRAVVSPLGNAPGADATEYRSVFDYDALGRLVSSTDPLGSTNAVEYDAGGHVTSTTAADGAVTQWTYDEAGQLTARMDAAGRKTTYEYDAAGRLIASTDPAGATSRQTYDVLGRVTSRTDATGRTTTLEYDAGNRLLATVAPSGARTTFVYDAADQLLTTTNPLGAASSTTYDPAGRPVRVMDADGRQATTSYDAAGRVVQVTRGDGSRLRWSYDVAGQLIEALDAAGSPARYTYDTAGRQISYTDTAGRKTTYGYDLDGRMAELTQPGQAVTTYGYDRAGRRTGTDYSDATPDVTTVYDAVGRVSSVTDGAGSSTYTRDVLGRVTEVARGSSRVGYGYDRAGNVATLTYPTGEQVQREYDAAGRLTSVTDWSEREFAYGYDEDGQVASLTFPNGVVTNYDTDLAGQTLGVATAASDGQALLDLAYSYTPAGLLASHSSSRPDDPRDAAAPSTDASSSYTWDALGRLAQVAGDAAGDVSFSPAGMITELNDGRTLDYDERGQLAAITGSSRTATFTYDARGNRTATIGDVTTTHTYDQANRLTGVDIGGQQTTYAYDANGLRTSASTDAHVEQYVWDTMPAAAKLLTDGQFAYIYGLGQAPVAQVDTATGDIDYLHTDLIGSVRSTTDAQGHITSDGNYDTYGGPLASAKPVAAITRFGFAGEYVDPTGYVYLRNRFYDPDTAQFLTVDPLIQSTADPYGYASGNPLQLTDPLGLDGWDDAGDWSAAFGDTVTFGATRWVRQQMGVDDVVDYCSVFYQWGGYAGTMADIGLAGAGSLQAGAALVARMTRAVQLAEGGAASLAGSATTAGLGLGGAANALPALPKALSGGSADTYVYLGTRNGKSVYTGITNNMTRRGAQHGERFDQLVRVTNAPVTRGQARSIEQALIARNPGFENKINSISPTHSYYDDAVRWGEAWLRQNGF